MHRGHIRAPRAVVQSTAWNQSDVEDRGIGPRTGMLRSGRNRPWWFPTISAAAYTRNTANSTSCRTICSNASSPTAKTADRHAELVRVLDDFRVSVRRHFDFEETGGYMKVVTDKRPQHAGRVEALRSEHGEILTLLDRLYDEVAVHAQGDLPSCNEFNDDFVALVRQFGRHEQAERELVMDVFWLEGGVSD